MRYIIQASCLINFGIFMVSSVKPNSEVNITFFKFPDLKNDYTYNQKIIIANSRLSKILKNIYFEEHKLIIKLFQLMK